MCARIPVLVIAATLLAPLGDALAQPKVEVMPASVDFGVSALGMRQGRELTIVNSGNMTLTISQVMLQDLTTMFALGPVQPPPLNLPAGAKFTVAVTFTPSNEGSFSATLMLGTNDPMAKNVRVPLYGVGARGSFVVDPFQIGFPATTPGQPGPPQTVSVNNTGKIDLMLCDAFLSGPNPTQFSFLLSGGKIMIPAGQSRPAVLVTYSPLAAGQHSASLTVEICGYPPTQVKLGGTAVAAPPDLSMTPQVRPDMAASMEDPQALADRAGCSVAPGRTRSGSLLLLALPALALVGLRRRRVQGVLAAMALLSGCTQDRTPQGELRREVRQAVPMLEAQRDSEFLERYMIPYQRQRYFGQLSPEARNAKFRSTAAAKLLARLKQAEKMTPTINAGNTEASYALDPELRFIRVDGLWRIAD